MMNNIAIVGAGQLGSRHLQGLLRLTAGSVLWIVDPSQASLEAAKARAAEIPGSEMHSVHYTQSLDAVPVHLDYAVIATSADVRLPVLQSLLTGREIGGLLLEKVLFQNMADYERADRLLHERRVPTWVNCTRRSFDIYRQVKEFIGERTLWSFEVSGGEWGLGCNSIHFLDLFTYLSGEYVTRFDPSGLDETIVPSRRKGFFEFTGVLNGRSASGQFRATARSGVSASITLGIRAGDRSCWLDETTGVAYFGDHAAGRWERRDFTVPFLSEISTNIAAAILDKGQTQLPTYAEAAACHRPFIAVLASFAFRHLGVAPGHCPIT